MVVYFRNLLILIAALFPFAAFSAATAWKIVPEKSIINFTATQNNSPVAGKFNSFSGDISFSPSDLATSKINITIYTGSVSASSDDVSSTLKSDDWFAIKPFPKAIFSADKFTKIDEKNYKAEGKLTLRDKTIPTTLNFTLEQFSEHAAKVKGYTTLKRNDFGVGQGEWSKTDSIKDEVKVEFVIEATK